MTKPDTTVHPNSRLPEGSQEHTHLVYDPATGEIVHGHKTVVLPNGNTPTAAELEQHALDMAAQATGRDAGTLKAVAIARDEIQPGAHYRIDAASGRPKAVATAI